MHVVIVGATGFIGRHLCRTCREEGIEVTVLARDPERAEAKIGALARIEHWDPAETPPPADALEGCDAVINLAGHPVACRWTRRARRLIHDSRVRTTQQLVGRINELERPPAVLLNASATGYYGDRQDEPLTERSQAGSGFLASVCCDWETAAMGSERMGIRVVPLRFGLVIGRRSPLLRGMLPFFRLRLGAILGSGDQWMPWVHIADTIGLILHALREPAIDGPLNVVAPQQVTNEQITRALAATLHRRVHLHVPRFLLRLAMGQMAGLLLASQYVLPEVAMHTGYQFRFPDIDGCLEDVLASR